MVSWRVIGVVFLAFIAVLFSTYAEADGSDDDVGSYPLDGVARVLADGEDLPCGEHELVVYRGTTLKLSKPARVHPAFAPKIAELERIVAEVAVPIYGRAPRTLVHLGTHNCRRMRLYPDWVSEHALGNAIDVAGFDFGPLAKNAPAPGELPRSLKRGFEVRLEQHWKGGRNAALAAHSTFLRALAQRLIDRPDLFRVVLGPAWPGHHNHFHLDFAPYRVVEVFKAGDSEGTDPAGAY
jgi:hypothetical protein